MVTLTYLTYSEKVNQNGRKETPKTHTFTVRVAAVYNSAGTTTTTKTIAKEFKTNIILSAKALMAMDPTLRYEDVCLTYTGAPDDEASLANVRDAIDTALVQSSGIGLKDYLAVKNSWAETARKIETPVLIMVGMFVLFIFLAFSLSNRVKVKSSLKSYAILRAIGLDKKQISKMLYLDVLRTCLWGILAGCAIGFGMAAGMAVNMFFVPIHQVFLTTMLPAAAIGALLIIGISLLSCIGPRKWILSQDIASSIHTVQY